MNTSPATTRPRGRPAGASSSDVRESLLDAAEGLFSQSGYAGTTIRAIAEAAGANPALVHYYFGTKRELLVAVMDRTLEPLAEAMPDFDERHRDAVGDFLRLLSGKFTDHPALPRLIVREAMLGDSEVRDIFVRDYAPRLGGAFVPVLRRLQQSARIRDDLDPGVLALLILSMSLFPTIAQPVAEVVLGLDFDGPGREHIANTAARLLDRGLAP